MVLHISLNKHMLIVIALTLHLELGSGVSIRDSVCYFRVPVSMATKQPADYLSNSQTTALADKIICV